VSLFEDARAAALPERRQVIAELAAHPGRRRARLVGMTGPPGAGKSSLVAELAPRVLALRPDWAIGVLAVDPSSPATGGALLGDRVRVRFPPADDRLFFRSQSSELELGGLGRHTFPVCRLLQHLFDVLLVETVGVGQSEIEITRLVDRTLLVLSPHWGDSIQLMKAGVMEVPDVVVLAKQDLAEAGRGAAAIEAELARRGGGTTLHRVSVRTGLGLDALAREIAAMEASGDPPLARREPHFFARWVAGELGRSGTTALEALGGAAAYLAEAGAFEAAMAAFPSDYRNWLAIDGPPPGA
jgi:LAO/AO transport system kinase